MSLSEQASDAVPFFSDESEAEGPEEQGGGAPRPQEDEEASGVSKVRALLTVLVLCYINLLNYMDRFTVAGVLPDIEHFFGINDEKSGLLQTVFICSYMFLAPVFGYLGDRYNRKYIMSVGILFWSLVTLASSYTPKEHFWALLLTRGLVGVGEASYSTIAPTIIADLYVKGKRTNMLSIFYFAIPVGRAAVVNGERPPCVEGNCASTESLIFGTITVVTGVLGVSSGVMISRKLRTRTARADPLVCAAGLLLSAPFLYLAIVFAQSSTVATYYVVVPTRRATAEALQIVFSHLLGDAGSPYLIGVLSDSLQQTDSFLWQFRSLQLSLLLCSFIAVIGGASSSSPPSSSSTTATAPRTTSPQMTSPSWSRRAAAPPESRCPAHDTSRGPPSTLPLLLVTLQPRMNPPFQPVDTSVRGFPQRPDGL
ncbi:hypothetical protein F7725_002953 [Dissostichus mawsoni]|uniref:Protein spinster homolog 1 n=1 Tax=Dissostichus mawsoni TaxID=36200 RepID=A0A7J5Y8U4_DISMA|nr:hypothetical protein F7725_002953 [Dissostichus mawsoni]